MRKNVAVLSIVMTMAMAGGAGATEMKRDPHVRPANQQGAALMAEGQEKSQTVRDLAAKLDQSDLVAYVVTASRLPDAPESAIRFIGRSKVQRFVLVQISNETPPDQRIELLAHELQHAVEAARSTWVNDENTLGTLFERIGWRDASKQRGYETTAASLIGRQVRRELVANATQGR
jgi:hypothetical protein